MQSQFKNSTFAKTSYCQLGLCVNFSFRIVRENTIIPNSRNSRIISNTYRKHRQISTRKF